MEEVRWPRNSGAYTVLKVSRSRRASILVGTVKGKWLPTLVLAHVANRGRNGSKARRGRLPNTLWGVWSYEKELRRVQRTSLLHTLWCGRFVKQSKGRWQGRMVKAERGFRHRFAGPRVEVAEGITSVLGLRVLRLHSLLPFPWFSHYIFNSFMYF